MEVTLVSLALKDRKVVAREVRKVEVVLPNDVVIGSMPMVLSQTFDPPIDVDMIDVSWRWK